MLLARLRPRRRYQLWPPTIKPREAELERASRERAVHADVDDLALVPARRAASFLREPTGEEGGEEPALTEDDAVQAVEVGEGDEVEVGESRFE